MKLIFLIILLLNTTILYANEVVSDINEKPQLYKDLAILETRTIKLDEAIISLDSNLRNAVKKQSSLNENIQKSYELQKEIQVTSLKFMSILESKNNETSPIGIELIQSTN